MSSEQPDRNWCRLTMPNDLAYVSVVQSFVCNVAVHFGFARDVLQGVELAVEEAVANVIEEAFSPDEVTTWNQLPNRAMAVTFCPSARRPTRGVSVPGPWRRLAVTVASKRRGGTMGMSSLERSVAEERNSPTRLACRVNSPARSAR